MTCRTREPMSRGPRQNQPDDPSYPVDGVFGCYHGRAVWQPEASVNGLGKSGHIPPIKEAAMADDRERQQDERNPDEQGGVGRREDVRGSGVYPLSHSEGASDDAILHGETSWGQGERGAEGYQDHGTSEINTWREVAPDQAPDDDEGDAVIG